jgi:DNA-binding winged helix-turn-helix (wHTH) protein
MEQITFGPFRLDGTTTTLLRDGHELELRPQAFHALRAFSTTAAAMSDTRR